jgi:hypothetical protein
LHNLNSARKGYESSSEQAQEKGRRNDEAWDKAIKAAGFRTASGTVILAPLFFVLALRFKTFAFD